MSAVGRTLPFVVLFGVSVVFRLIQIDQESFFIDEALTLKFCQAPTFAYVRDVERTPPFYFYLVKFWTLLFGISHVSLRMVSALFGSIAPALVYASARELRISRIGAFLAGLFLATAPMSVWYGQQARCYAILATTVALWLFLTIKTGRARGRSASILLTAALVLGFSTHYFFVFPVLGGWGVLLIHYLRNRPSPRMRRTLLSHLIAFVILCVYLPLIYVQLAHGGGEWIERPGLRDLLRVFGEVFMVGPFHRPDGIARLAIVCFYGLVGCALVWAILSTNRIRSSRPGSDGAPWGIFLFVTTLTSILAPFVLSLGEHSNFITDRTTIVGLPPFFLAAIYLLDRRGPRAMRYPILLFAALALLPLNVVHDIRYWRTYQDFDWKGAAEIVHREWREGDAILFLPGWMHETYRANGGGLTRVLDYEQLEQLAKEQTPRRLWVFEWEGNPDEKGARFSHDLRNDASARIRMDFPHIKLLEVPQESIP